jgi:hypothetical protein
MLRRLAWDSSRNNSRTPSGDSAIRVWTTTWPEASTIARSWPRVDQSIPAQQRVGAVVRPPLAGEVEARPGRSLSL